MAGKQKCEKCGADLVCHCPICEGRQGGRKAAKGMTVQERRQRAQKAAEARWSKKKE